MTIATYYDILKVDRAAAPAGVRAAYRSLAQRYHPDKFQGSHDAARVMAMLNEAYAVLSNPEQRARYDRSIDARLASLPRAAAPAERREPAWPWWLLFATIAFALTSICAVAYKMAFPGVAAAAVHASAQKASANPATRPARH